MNYYFKRKKVKQGVRLEFDLLHPKKRTNDTKTEKYFIMGILTNL